MSQNVKLSWAVTARTVRDDLLMLTVVAKPAAGTLGEIPLDEIHYLFRGVEHVLNEHVQPGESKDS